MAARELKTPPAYVVTSVDHALRIAVMLQLEGALTVSQVADRLGVARSTAHRLLSMLVYRDFAAQDDERRLPRRPGARARRALAVGDVPAAGGRAAAPAAAGRRARGDRPT